MKCSHVDPLDLPEFLCRRCHPELNMTPERRAALDAADREHLSAKTARENRERERRRAEERLEILTKRGEPDPESVNGKVTASLRKKRDRLIAEDDPFDSAGLGPRVS